MKAPFLLKLNFDLTFSLLFCSVLFFLLYYSYFKIQQLLKTKANHEMLWGQNAQDLSD